METTCQVCGSAIPEDTPSGGCPACALKSAFSTTDDLEGKVIGNYTIIEQIGKGGFGVVYLAGQSTPVRRHVALKILNRSSVDESVKSQFFAEQQALAMMNHPHIAKIFDAGETEWGVPYFVMELIEGEPITRYCNRKKLTPKERIELFREVCGAIHYAHQKAIIHRDIKPANILVEEVNDRPVPKVIDFGVAKAMGAPLVDLSFHLRTGHVIGTPEYMPPEQARGDSDIDTRADIYSLGVLLYELLIGAPPFSRKDLEEAGIQAILSKIENDPPPSPSQRFSSMEEEMTDIAEQRHIAPSKLLKLVRGDLDWIVMKALEKPRKWRYDTAGAMAIDIDCYLEDMPLPSRRKTLVYRARKFARRNRMLVATAGALAAVLVVGLFAAWSVQEANAEKTAEGLYQRLFDCRIERLPSVLADIRPYHRHIAGRLQEQVDDASAAGGDRARARLALLPYDAAQLDPLGEWLLLAPAGEMGVYLGLLENQRDELAESAWEILLDESEDRDLRLHAAAICAAFDPTSLEWKELGDQVAGWLVAGSLRWIPLLQPVANMLVDPLQGIYEDRKAMASGSAAADALAEFLHNKLDKLLALVETAGPHQLWHLAGVLSHQAAAEPALAARLAAPIPGGLDQAAHREAARQRARHGLALLMMRHPTQVWPSLRHGRDPELRTSLIHGLAEYDVDPSPLIAYLDAQNPQVDPGILSAILIALGDYDSARIPPPVRIGLQPPLEKLYSDHPDVGVHSAAEWLLREWELDANLAELNRGLPVGLSAGDRNWFLTSGGNFTMAILPEPIKYRMGSPDREERRGDKTLGVKRDERDDDEHPHEEDIDRRVAIALKEVTIAQFMPFAKLHNVQRKMKKDVEPGKDPWDGLRPPAMKEECAVPYVTLKEAMVYCWWLSNKEGLEQCYEFDPEKPWDEKNNPRTREDYLLKEGYRLPTEAEWEFACRGGTNSARYYGSDDRLLIKYGWYRIANDPEPSVRPPGQLRPNAYGLFDSLGNVSEWCQDAYREVYRSHPTGLAREVGEAQLPRELEDGVRHGYRGGSYFSPANDLRAAKRYSTSYRHHSWTSFRIARTIKNG